MPRPHIGYGVGLSRLRVFVILRIRHDLLSGEQGLSAYSWRFWHPAEYHAGQVPGSPSGLTANRAMSGSGENAKYPALLAMSIMAPTPDPSQWDRQARENPAHAAA